MFIRIISCLFLSIFGGFAMAETDIVTLENEHAVMTFSPQIGRITSFRLRNGKNILWSNPRENADSAGLNRGWVNYGGDKVWCASQDQWKIYQGRDWPPDASIDGACWQVLAHSSRKLIVRSPVSRYYGVFITRTMELADDAPVLRIQNTLEATRAHPGPVMVWTVSQLPLASVILAGRNGEAITPVNIKPEWPIPAESFRKDQSGNILHYRYPTEERSSVSVFCDWLAMVYKKTVFVQYSPGTSNRNGFIYTDPNERYMEFEFSGSSRILNPGERMTLTLFWLLFPETDYSIRKLADIITKECSAWNGQIDQDSHGQASKTGASAMERVKNESP